MKNEKGITLIALVITMIVLLIIAGVEIGTNMGTDDIETTNTQVKITELSQVQQIVLETYIKSQQTHNSNYLIGTKIEYSEAQNALEEIDATLSLKSEDGYYKLSTENLETLGINKATDTYIVNYSTGEAFNITKKHAEDGTPLYICN